MRAQQNLTPAARMTQLLIDRTTATGCCTEADLERAGFTAEDIAAHLPAARKAAAGYLYGARGGVAA